VERRDLMKKFVLDTSVIIKWFTSEIDSEKACKIRDAYLKGDWMLTIPELTLFEVANAFKYSTGLSKSEIKRNVKSIIDMEIELMPFELRILNQAIDLAVTKEITVYDAYFIAQAKELSYQLITADVKCYEKVKTLSWVVLLSEIED
jgi:predicted nucleic acid-binding protein